MPDTVITVQGRHIAWFPAERATVTISVGFDGPTRDPVFSAATESAAAVRATVVGLHDSEKGPVTWWAADSIRVWSQRPWNDKGEQLEPVHHAALELRVKFSAFDTLASWIESVSSIAGANVIGIDWELTEVTKISAIREVRIRAVEDAAEKARAYADAIGLSSLTAIAVADPGMLGEGRSGSGGDYDALELRAAKSVGGADSGGALEFTPEQIEVSAAVDARFLAAK